MPSGTPRPAAPTPVDMVLSDDVTRSPDLVPIRHGRMATDPFAFYRGAAAIMVADLATTPSSGVVAQLCGDAHLSNFGVFASPERQLLFDLYDFEFASAYADQNDADFEAYRQAIADGRVEAHADG
jgi:hypothetical protein